MGHTDTEISNNHVAQDILRLLEKNFSQLNVFQIDLTEPRVKSWLEIHGIHSEPTTQPVEQLSYEQRSQLRFEEHVKDVMLPSIFRDLEGTIRREETRNAIHACNILELEGTTPPYLLTGDKVREYVYLKTAQELFDVVTGDNIIPTYKNHIGRTIELAATEIKERSQKPVSQEEELQGVRDSLLAYLMVESELSEKIDPAKWNQLLVSTFDKKNPSKGYTPLSM